LGDRPRVSEEETRNEVRARLSIMLMLLQGDIIIIININTIIITVSNCLHTITL